MDPGLTLSGRLPDSRRQTDEELRLCKSVEKKQPDGLQKPSMSKPCVFSA